MLERLVIAPNDVGRLSGDSLDAVASEDVLALGIEAVLTAGDWTCFVDEAGAGGGIEKRAADGARCGCAVPNPGAKQLRGIMRHRVQGGGDRLPFGRGDERSGRETAAALVAPLTAGPVRMRGDDGFAAVSYGVLDLVQSVHDTEIITAGCSVSWRLRVI